MRPLPARRRIRTDEVTRVPSKTALKTKSKASIKPVKKPPAKAASAKLAAVRKAAPRKPEPPKAAAKPAKAPLKPVLVIKGKVPAKPVPGVPPKKQPDAKAGGKILAKPGMKPGEGEPPPGDADSPLLDMSDVGVRKMITRAKQRGYVTYDELNKVLPSEKVSSEQI